MGVGALGWMGGGAGIKIGFGVGAYVGTGRSVTVTGDWVGQDKVVGLGAVKGSIKS